MNFSEKHKIIWWAPERCATRLISNIFQDYDFYYQDNEKVEVKKICSPYHSHTPWVPEKYSDYNLICSIRNPYDRVLSLFVNFTQIGDDAVFLKKNKKPFIDKFSIFVDELFYNQEFKKQVSTPKKYPVFNNYVSKWTFEERIPNTFIRMENLEEDLEKLDFIRESDKWIDGSLKEQIKKNKFIVRRPYTFNEVYSFENAKKVYNFYKNHFYLCEYNPFSFTTEKLTDNEKKKFLHGII